ncbi:transglutaminase-like domain-containing protein [Neorhizobium sp. BETTINA12A]|uniref:transglutaminase-like domain-containing protein n=1 Tax=Neorhizobium sp. BETTINA12A TaxID=2908924 RepID=UPI001FF2B82C|nr:transglutaminase-like domain-containing protein [Neorhizobium sp. BETTINA12A]MCJ9750668.1 transglutaminase-like domain-containing protein [Neorhizobium sp. BETTINA12A]
MNIFMNPIKLIAVWLICLFGSSVYAQDLDFQVDKTAVELNKLFIRQPVLEEAKLAIDQLADPTTDPVSSRTTLDRMTADVVRMAGLNAGNVQKLEALKRYLYESGEWNAFRPFTYDLADPLGENPTNRLLQRYLDTRQGNCITMPILFLALGQRLGLKMTLAQAPLHVFVKYTDDSGSTWNLEATSGGGFTRDLWYRQKLPMSDDAIAKGIYLRPLRHDEAVALIASLLVEHHLAEGRFDAAILTADAILQHYPDFAYLLVKKGSAYSALLQRELAGKYTRPSDIPPDVKAKVDRWYQENITAFAQAEALGWRPEDGQAP